MKITSLLLSLLFLGFALVQLNDSYWFPWTIAYLLSAYTAASAFRNYYNPMLLMMMAVGYLIAGIICYPAIPLSEWLNQEQQAASFQMNMPFTEEARESMGLFFCAVVNFWLMWVGFGKARQKDYNEQFSVKGRN